MVGDSSPAEPQSAAAVGMPSEAVPGTDTTLANADAERALLRLKQKLAGMEGGKVQLVLSEPHVYAMTRTMLCHLRHGCSSSIHAHGASIGK